MVSFTLTLAAATLGTPRTTTISEAPVGAPQVRETIERSLKFLDKAGFDWVSKSCVGCHHGPWMLWSHHEAQKRGFEINEKTLEQVRLRSLKDYTHPKLQPTGMDKLNDLSINAIFLTFGLGAAKTIDADASKLFDRTAAHLIEQQKANGSWHVAIKDKPEGLMQPIFDRDDVTTLWALLTLNYREPEGVSKEALEKSKEKATKWLSDNPSSGTMQSLMLRVLLAKRLGKNDEMQLLVKQLLGLQNADGGWSQEKDKDKPSDALGTGQSLFALTTAGITSKDPAVAKAWTFLAKTQKPDGSWVVKSRAAGTPKFSSYMGTSWATIGLVRSLPE